MAFEALMPIVAIAGDSAKTFTVAASEMVGRKAAGDYGALTPTEARVILGLAVGDSPTFSAATITNALGATNLDGILGANTPAAVSATTCAFSGAIALGSLGVLGFIAHVDTDSYIQICGGINYKGGATIALYGEAHASHPGRLLSYFGGLDAIGECRWYHVATDNSLTLAMDLGNTGGLNVIGNYSVDGTQVVGNQGLAVADASTSHAVASFADTNTALDALATQFNTLLARDRAHGLIAT